MKWFADQETNKSKWRSDIMYKDIIKWKSQIGDLGLGET